MSILTALERFDLKTVVEAVVRFPLKVTSPCHWWIGARSTGGQHWSQRKKGGKRKKGKPYGSFWFEGKMRRAHRWIWIQFKGEIPPKYEIDHVCDNSLCVNLEHLRCVPGVWNAARANAGRKAA